MTAFVRLKKVPSFATVIGKVLTSYLVFCLYAGSGKTYTVEGGAKNCQGIIPRATQLIFSRIQNTATHSFIV